MSPSFVLVLTLLFVSSITIIDAYDYFVMAVQWPPSVCRPVSSPCPKAPLPKFTIHGMWPGDSVTGARLNFCSGSTFDITLLSQKLQRDLDNAWPNWKGANPKFWEEQWRKHGTCSENNLNQFQYFEKAVEIFLTLDMDSTLDKGGVVQGTPCLLAKVKTAIKSATKMDPIVICVGGRTRLREIEEIRVCIDDKYKFINCPPSAGSDLNCADPINWLP